MPTKSGGGGKQEQFDTKTGQYVESGKSVDKEDLSEVKDFKDKISQFKASNANSGYSGYSMSNRAVMAYESGEMPLSKWSKEEILDNVESYIKQNNIQDIDLDKIKKMSLQDLKRLFLNKSSWHHTSKMYNKTDFYRLNEYYIDTLSPKLEQEYKIKMEKVREKMEAKKKEEQKKIDSKEWLSFKDLEKKYPDKIIDNIIHKDIGFTRITVIEPETTINHVRYYDSLKIAKQIEINEAEEKELEKQREIREIKRREDWEKREYQKDIDRLKNKYKMWPSQMSQRELKILKEAKVI